MIELTERYDIKPAAAWIRGRAMVEGLQILSGERLEMPIGELTGEER